MNSCFKESWPVTCRILCLCHLSTISPALSPDPPAESAAKLPGIVLVFQFVTGLSYQSLFAMSSNFSFFNRQLAESGAHVVMAVRNLKAANELIQKWQEEWSGRGLPLNIEVLNNCFYSFQLNSNVEIIVVEFYKGFSLKHSRNDDLTCLYYILCFFYWFICQPP